MDHLTDPTKPIRDEKDQLNETSPVLLSAGDESGLSGEEVDKAPIPLKAWIVVALCVIAQYNLTVRSRACRNQSIKDAHCHCFIDFDCLYFASIR